MSQEEAELVKVCSSLLNYSDVENEETLGDIKSEECDEQASSLSKRERRRLLRKQQWLDTKHERRQKEKEKRKRKMAERKENGQFAEDITRTMSRKAVKYNCKMAESKCKVGVVFDFQFGDLMNDRDMGKALKQVLTCYTLNRRLENPLQMHISSMEGRVAEQMSKHDGYTNWDVNIHKEGLEVFPPASLVYLSSDSANVLKELEADKVYVIGALVDHNHHKGLCENRAKELNLASARLPLDEYVSLKTRKVLTVNHVFEIMTEVTQGSSWKDAFMKVIPERKGINQKNAGASCKEEGESISILPQETSFAGVQDRVDLDELGR